MPVRQPRQAQPQRSVAELGHWGATETTFIDAIPDSVLENQPAISYDGPPPSFSTTRVIDLLRQDGPDTNELVFPETGVLQFTPRKGGRTLATKELVITDTTTVQDLVNFMSTL